MAESPEEALSASLNRYGGVNLPYMESLCDMAQADMLEALKGRVYYNPLAGNYEIADRFIAGNVVVKAKEVEEWVKGHEGHGDAAAGTGGSGGFTREHTRTNPV